MLPQLEVDLPIGNVCKNNFGTTPGTPRWLAERKQMQNYKPT